MGVQHPEVFSLAATTPAGVPFRGQSALTFRAGARGQFYRGFDLSAGFDLRAHVQGHVEDVVEASFSGGVEVSGGLAVRAQFPMDLFDEGPPLASGHFP